MARLNIELFKSKTYKNGEHPIMLRLSFKSKHKYIYTGHSVKVDVWDLDKNLPKNPKLRNLITNKFTAAENIIFEIEKETRQYTIDEMVAKIKTEGNTGSFFTYVNEVIEGLRKSKRIGSAENYRTIKNVVRTFTNDVDISFDTIDYKWLKKFEEWHLSKGNTVGGLGVYMRSIRALYNSAIKNHEAKIDNYPFGRTGYQISSQPVRHRAISKEQINKIRNLDLEENSSLWHTRNYFLFSFFCRGMNWVDMANLTPSNIVNGRLEYIRIKTKRKSSKSFSIKINDQIQNVLNIYMPGKNNDDFIFPIIFRKSLDDVRRDIKNGLKTFNKYLRKIAVKAEIQGNITSYVARHSWGTIGKRAGVDLSVLSDGYGHADANVTRVYLDSIENDDIDNANDIITE